MKTRKSLYDISWQVTEETYRQGEGYSYSTLAKFNREGFENLSTLFDKVESPSLLFGSMVDTLLTDGQDAFDNRFVVADFPPVSDTIKNIVIDLFNIYKDSYNDIFDIPVSLIIPIADAKEYYKNWKPETRAGKIREQGEEYYRLLYIAKDKQLVETKMYQDALACVDNLRTSEYTKFYFEKDNPFNNDTERFYQLKFTGEYEGIPIRCMMDLVIVDHKNKIIIPVDLKTSYKPEYKFYKSFIEWNYWIQAQLYAEILRQNIIKDDYFKDFTIQNYRFIVVSNGTKYALVWEYPDTWATEDLYYGNRYKVYCRNWRNIVKDLHYYLTSQAKVPIGITEINNIIEWLNHE